MKDDLQVQAASQKELVDMIAELRNVVGAQANCLIAKNRNVNDRNAVFFPAIMKLRETARVIVQMKDMNAADEMQVLLRSMVELAVNACYLQHASDEVVNQYLNFAAIEGFVAMTDFMRAADSQERLPDEMIERITELANKAQSNASLTLKSRRWSTVSGGLDKRALVVDREVGGNAFAKMVAAMYTTGSGYVHGDNKILSKYFKYLAYSREEPMVERMWEANNALHGVAMVLIVVAQYLASRFNLNLTRIAVLQQELIVVVEASQIDYEAFRKRNQTS